MRTPNDVAAMADADGEHVEYDDSDVAVRIAVVGDRGCGKSSLIWTLLEDEYSANVPAQIETILIPPDVTPDGVLTAIVDYSTQVHDDSALADILHAASVIVIVFSVKSEENLRRVSTYWMPLIHKTLGPDSQRPCIIVGNQSDDVQKSDYVNQMVSLMSDYTEIETVVECSALAKKNVSEVFYYAQRAVIYPMSPLYDTNRRELTPRFKKALVRIFKLSDVDNDGLLSNHELRLFQLRAFNMPLTDEALDEVKTVIQSYDSTGVLDNGITLSGFFNLHEAFMQRGRAETAWTALRGFGYNKSLQLEESYLYPLIQIPKGSSTELSAVGLAFVRRLFRKYDEDRDGKLSPAELKNLLSVCPANSWPNNFLHSTILDENGWLSEQAFVNLWTLNVALNLPEALEQLAYHGFNLEHRSQLDAIVVTRDRRIDIAEKTTERTVFQCHVIGAKNAGKTVFSRSFLGETLNRILQLRSNQKPTYVINTADIRGKLTYLIIHEVDVYSPDDVLSNYEKNADVICLLYDGTDANSFTYCAKLYLRYFFRTKVPCLFVASKTAALDFEQSYEFQPSTFCHEYQLPNPVRFNELGNARAPVYVQLATMAAYPHLKRVYFLQDSSLLSKLTVGAAVAALAGFLIYKNL